MVSAAVIGAERDITCRSIVESRSQTPQVHTVRKAQTLPLVHECCVKQVRMLQSQNFTNAALSRSDRCNNNNNNNKEDF